MSGAGSVLLEDPTYSTTCKAELRYIRTLLEHPAFPVHNLNSITSGALLDMSIYVYLDVYISTLMCDYAYLKSKGIFQLKLRSSLRAVS